jgi:hypothetical protein
MYELYYDTEGKVCGILDDKAFFNKDSKEYQAFLAWNSKQASPLNVNSAIAIKPRDLTKEIDELKAQLIAKKVI